jgi:hypothetical protein
MKKIALLSFCFCLATLLCKSQYFVGGSINFDSQGGHTKTDDTTTKSTGAFNYTISPQIGKQLSEKVDIGFALTFGQHYTNNNQNPETKWKSISLGFNPFVRYYIFEISKFSLYGQLTGIMNFTKSKITTEGNSNEIESKVINLGLQLYPGISYRINEKIELMAGINLFRFGFYQTFTKTNDYNESESSFGFGANMDQMFTTGSLTVGAIFRF